MTTTPLRSRWWSLPLLLVLGIACLAEAGALLWILTPALLPVVGISAGGSVVTVTCYVL